MFTLMSRRFSFRSFQWLIPLFLLLAGITHQWHPDTLSIDSHPSSISTHEKTAWEVCFTPGQNCAGEVVKAIEEAKKTVLVQAYSFTSSPIARALVEAHQRGVKIQVILDKSQKTEKYSVADFLSHAGIETYLDTEHAIAHNKVIILDQITVITGSFNFTKAAQEKNAENLLVLNDPQLAALYERNWKTHLEHAQAY